MIQAPFNTILVKIGEMFLKRVSDIMKTSMESAHGSSLNPADLVNIFGEVVSVPLAISDRRDYKEYTTENIRVGDGIIFRYDVIYAFSEGSGNKVFKNMFYYERQEYWVCDIQKAFAVVREGNIIMLNDYCMVENISDISKLVLPAYMKKMIPAGTATLTHISPKSTLGLSPIDTVFFNPLLIQKYNIKGKEFGIIKGKQIFGARKAGLENFLVMN